MQERFKIEDTCAVPCTARELINQQDPLTRRIPPYTRDEKGFLICGACHKLLRSQLKICPECGWLFRGPKPYRPLKFDLECEACE
jgi:uncharacterized C2H2 Zn-finger protein